MDIHGKKYRLTTKPVIFGFCFKKSNNSYYLKIKDLIDKEKLIDPALYLYKFGSLSFDNLLNFNLDNSLGTKAYPKKLETIVDILKISQIMFFREKLIAKKWRTSYYKPLLILFADEYIFDQENESLRKILKNAFTKKKYDLHIFTRKEIFNNKLLTSYKNVHFHELNDNYDYDVVNLLIQTTSSNER